jgi:hypothetical protein
MTADLLVSFIALIGILALFYGPWQDLCTDYARQVVFEQRDSVFDLAARGEMDFRSKEYREIRSALESFIRFAHEITFFRLTFVIVNKDALIDDESESRLKASVENVADPILRKELEGILSRTQTAMLFLMGARSLPFVVLFPVVLFLALVAHWFFAFKDHCDRVLSWLADLMQMDAEYEAGVLHVKSKRFLFRQF